VIDNPSIINKLVFASRNALNLAFWQVIVTTHGECQFEDADYKIKTLCISRWIGVFSFIVVIPIVNAIIPAPREGKDIFKMMKNGIHLFPFDNLATNFIKKKYEVNIRILVPKN